MALTARRVEASFHIKVQMPDDSHYHVWLKDGTEYMGEYGKFSVYLMLEHQVLPSPDVLRSTAEYAQRIRELNGQKPYMAASTDWIVAMQLWMTIQSIPERLRVRTNTTAFGVAIEEALDGTMRNDFVNLAKQWQDVAMAYASSGLAVQACLAEMEGMAQDLHLGPDQALANAKVSLHDVQVALNVTRHIYGNFTQELGLSLQTTMNAALVQLNAAASVYESAPVNFATAESLLQQAVAIFNAPTPSAVLNFTVIQQLEDVATHLLESVYAFNASVGVRMQRAVASLRVAAANFHNALPSDDQQLAKYSVQFGQREFLRRLGDMIDYVADPLMKVVFTQWWNTTLFPMEFVGIHARNTAKTLKATLLVGHKGMMLCVQLFLDPTILMCLI